MAKLYFSEKYGCYGIFHPWCINPQTQEKIWAKTYGYKSCFIPVDELESEKVD